MSTSVCSCKMSHADAVLPSKFLTLKGINFQPQANKLESTNTTGRVPHPRPTRDAASDVVTRMSVPRLCFFFFFSRICADSARFTPTWLDSCQIGFDSHRTGLIRPESGHIGHIGSYRPAIDTAETAKIGLEYGQKSRNYHFRGIVTSFLPFFFFVL